MLERLQTERPEICFETLVSLRQFCNVSFLSLRDLIGSVPRGPIGSIISNLNSAMHLEN
jgi:hypothetical protein